MIAATPEFSEYAKRLAPLLVNHPNAGYSKTDHQEHDMSKLAAGFLIMTLLTGILHLSLAQEKAVTLPLIACAVFGSLFVLALVAGRKIKFDPVLR